MASGKRIPQKPCSSLSLSVMAVLSVGIIGCQDTPTDVTDAPVQLAVGSASVAAPADVFVDDDNAGGVENGTSWATAFGNLNDALASATDVDSDGAIAIWIAEGTYVPSAVYSPGGVEGGAYGEKARSAGGALEAQYEADRDAGFLNTFYLRDGVGLYGGFRGLSGGGDANDRDTPAFRTILSGDVLGNDKLKRDHPRYRDFRADNVWHVTSAGNDTPTLGGGAVLMDGLTIEGGDAVDAPFDGVPGFVWRHGDGGGLYAHNSDVSLNDLVVERNESIIGGGIVLRTRTTFTTSFVATHSTFRDNHAGDVEPGPGFTGGAIFVFGAFAGSTGLIENSTFTENTAGGGGGGAVVAFGVTMTVRNNHFEGNAVRHAGGALQSRSFPTPATKYIIEDNTFTANFAGDRSGAVDMVAGDVELRRNVFLNNRSDANNGDGGGAVAVARGENNIVEDNHFEGNTSGGNGGAGLFGLDNDVITLRNNTYIANRSEGFGGGYSIIGGLVTSTGEIFEANSALEAGGAVSVLAFFPPQSASISGATFDGNFAEGLNSPNVDAVLASVGFAFPDPTHAGGAISNALDATLTINDSKFENNYAVNGKGGAIANGGSLIEVIGPGFTLLNGAVLTVNNSVFNGNNALADDGGAISSERIEANINSPVTVEVNESDFDENSASGNGGAVSAEAVTFDSFKDHYNFNTAGGNGGALYFKDATGALKKETFKDNDADGLGDSMYLEGSPLGLKNITIEGEDGNDVVIVADISSPTAAGVSGPAGVGAVGSTEARRMSLDGFARRWKFLLCDDDLRKLSLETGALECSIDGSGR